MDIRRKLENAYKGKENNINSEDKSQNKKSSSTMPKDTIKDGAFTKATVNKATQTSETLIKIGGSGIDKAAKFLLLLGKDEAAHVMQHLKPAEIEAVAASIAKIEGIDNQEASQILAEFGFLVQHGADLEGGPETAKEMLKAAFGEDKAKEVYKKAVKEERKPFVFLNDFEAKQIHALLKDESAQTMAMIVTYLEPRKASSFLADLPSSQRIDVVKRIAKMEKTSPEVLERVENTLRDKIEKIGRVDTVEKIDGTSVLADILKHMGSNLEDDILQDIEYDNPALSQTIRDRLFTIDDIMRVSSKDMQKGLRSLNEADIAMVLKGKSDIFKDKILHNVSQSRRMAILEEYEILGQVRREDVDKATEKFLSYYKSLWEQGRLILDGEEELID